MLAWASKQLNTIADAVAPPASTPSHRFLAAVSARDENSALASLSGDNRGYNPETGEDFGPLDPHTILNPTKGYQAVHLSCQNGLMNLTRSLITNYGVLVDTFDYAGNTPLHHAAANSDGSPYHFDLVKMLVTEFRASVVVKNGEGQTPYDVSTGMNVRNWLLPLQLQQETQKCLDEGGAGLMPGIDLGGAKVNESAMAPPPMGGMGMPPPGGAGAPSSGSMYAPPPMMQQHVGPGAASPGSGNMYAPPPMMQQQGVPVGAAASPSPGSGNMYAAPSPMMQQQGEPPVVPNAGVPPHVAAPIANTAAPPPPAAAPPPSGNNEPRSYSRFNSSDSDSKYKPDGFHSSASDVDLQRKYGHVNANANANLPPPPTGGANFPPPPAAAAAAGEVRSGPASAGSKLPPPPFSYSAYGNAAAATKPRYPVYDAVTGVTSAPPPLPMGGSSAPSSFGAPPPVMQMPNVFNPMAPSPTPAAPGVPPGAAAINHFSPVGNAGQMTDVNLNHHSQEEEDSFVS
eukprot:CAMPEP_0195520534 /NCGR_PEP_ID=MMETSP0794_2-20130614/17113_1 /TAXON_ID=515487 /ORGANISM="Stephanopyxis turris, Strain CCMP 815" /LENGTH=512 /DNA_ID=CAMNT_0040649915 /DNA_START=42 /DNA_END=1580 /DNA_ORIENTATION=+